MPLVRFDRGRQEGAIGPDPDLTPFAGGIQDG